MPRNVVARKTHSLRAAAVAAVAALALGGCADGSAHDFSIADSRNDAGLQAGDLSGYPGLRMSSGYGDFLAGQFASRQRDLGAAADHMARALRDDPDNRALLQQTFQFMAADGRMDEARTLAERLLEQEAHHPPALLMLAVDRLHDGDIDAAAGYAEKLPQRGLAGVVRPLAMAWLLAKRDGAAAGMEALEDLRDSDGFGVLRALHTALIHDLDGDGDGAAARAGYDEALESAGGLSLRLAWLIGNFHERQGAHDEATALYHRFLAQTPDSTPMRAILDDAKARETAPPRLVDSTADGVAEALFNLAGLLSQQRSANEISLIYTQMALHLKPEFDSARMLLGDLLQGQERHRAAIEVFREVPEDSAMFDEARLRIGESLQELERFEEAAAVFKAAAEDMPARFMPLYNLGNLYRVQERFEEAEAAYAEALERVERLENRHWTLLYFHAIALERIDRWDDAEAQFKTALDLEPEEPHVMNYLAYSWVELEKNLDRAEEMLTRAVELRPDDGYIVDSLGWVHYRLGNYDKAVKYLERAVELRPHDAVINDHLGDAYWKVGRKQEARFQWMRARNLDPDDEVLSAIEAKLDGGLDALDRPDG